MRTRFVALASLFLTAEVAATFWLWGRAPTDTLRDWHPSFWAFELDRLRYWLPVSAALLGSWFLASYALARRNRRNVWWFVGVAVGIGAEVATSTLYWKSPRSSYLRGLYESVWAWERVPQASDLGWPSFRIYLWSHFIPWAFVLVLGMIVWLRFERKARDAGDIPTQGTPPY